ncbi:MAG: regulatory protein TetR [Acidimicrobiales bacterium]|nr:regulatory protein TetR [Acidimicrobiales bacterium]
MAATRVFAEKGYRRAQMADVASALGVSAGNLYNYVQSKDALFHACLAAASPAREPRPRADQLPLPTPASGAIEAVVARGIKVLRQPGPLASALKVNDPTDVAAELRAIIGDFYDRTRSTRRFQALVERSAPDMPGLYEAFFTKMRRPGLSTLSLYLERRIASGHLRPVPHVPTTARLINETQAWFARHRGNDQDPSDVDDSLARETVIDVLVAGLLPRLGPPPRKQSPRPSVEVPRSGSGPR